MKSFLKKIEEINSYNATTISGLNDGEKSFLPLFLQRKCAIVCPNRDALDLYKENMSLSGKKVITLDDKLPLIISLNDSATNLYKEYIVALTRLASGDFDILLLNSSVLFQKLPQKDYFLSNTLSFQVGKSYNLSLLQSKLVQMGYKMQDLVSEQGDFSIRGDLLDVFPVNIDKGIRISFFDDEIESISYFDAQTFKVEKQADKVDVFCAKMLYIEESQKPIVIDRIKSSISKLSLPSDAMLRLSEVVGQEEEYLCENISAVSNVFFLPFVDYFSSSILDYLENDTSIIFDEPKLITDRIDAINDENISSFLDLSLRGEFLPEHMQFYLEKKSVFSGLSRFKLIAFSRLLKQNKIFEATSFVNFICQNVRQYYNHYIDLVDDIKNYQKHGYDIALSYPDTLTLNKLQQFLTDENIPFEIAKDLNKMADGKVCLIQNFVKDSVHFEMEKLLVVASHSLNPHIVIPSSHKISESKAKFLPKVGEYVVHEVHGIGKCIGIQNLKLSSSYKDYIVIEYKDGDLLYLPSENADLLSAYSSEGEVKCNKIGGTDFFKVKQKVKSSVKEMAFDLIKVYGERMSLKGFVYSEDSYLQKAFEDAFPYEYTEDQLTAIMDIKRDMQSTRIMDRLLCGDVGFGKTEVALCAAFKAIQDGKQVAIICPTTILCEQHFVTATSRMKDFFVRVEAINRFKTKKQQTDILGRLQKGEIDLICGTHRLLSSDVKFKDLGLIIIDEEQRFGVEDKDKLKNIKKTVDVLSLSATPIPRTLYMSLSGMRDVSYLTTPPKSRKRINTAIIDYSDTLLVNACRRELDRGGQVLIVYNKVETIANFYRHVKNLLPDVEIGFAHGQMDSKTLENAIYNLYSRKTQILISTILIENGIDLPYANTLFVIDADKLGLSQLYQLRGRIGRSDIEAYAYFSFKKDKALTIDAYKRLDAIMEFGDFGSGYKVALRDLEIRGAGDVLGKFQHGHMMQVGYDMYMKLLGEAVRELKGEKVAEFKEVKINISLGAFIPDSYISSSESRISLYSSIAKISEEKELKEFLDSTASIYGPIPKPVVELCTIGYIKNLAKKIYVKSITISEFESKVVFYDEIRSVSAFELLKVGSTMFSFVDGDKVVINIKREKDVYGTQANLICVLKDLTKDIK